MAIKTIGLKGDLSRGFARVKCKDCGHEYLLAFSCKRRHFCPSCHQKRGQFSLLLQSGAPLIEGSEVGMTLRLNDSRGESIAFQSVPEPATMLLPGLGLMGLAGVRRKFKK